ncbi:MAG: cyclic nucleotide-binding/CBS domain-containing protein [Planctomycetota bacterium]|jgi:CBS domain-containing protein
MSNTLRELRARDIMSTDVQWTTTSDNLLAAGRRMAEHGLRSLLVRGDHPTDLPGIVTSKDIVNLLGTHDPELLGELRVGDVMTRPAICVPAQTNLRDCINLMRLSSVRRLPVLDGTAVIGVLSSTDIFRRALAEA